MRGIFHFSPLSFSPRNLSSASFFSLITFEVSFGIYKVIRYLPSAEPTTPTIKTSQIFRLNFIWKNTITDQAGGPIKGIRSTSKEEIKTNT